MGNRVVKYEVSVRFEGDGDILGMPEAVCERIKKAIQRSENECPLYAAIGVTASLESVTPQGGITIEESVLKSLREMADAMQEIHEQMPTADDLYEATTPGCFADARRRFGQLTAMMGEIEVQLLSPFQLEVLRSFKSNQEQVARVESFMNKFQRDHFPR